MKTGASASPIGADSTIFALASGMGRAAVAVVRISGPAAGDGLRRMLGGRLPAERRASLRSLRDTHTGEVLDRAIVLWMPGPATFTGEDQAELQIHGSVAVRSAVLGALGRIAGFRQAEPGEFTRRAFRNGKLDLSAAEGLADLIDAETEAQRRQANRLLEGALAKEVEAWRVRLLAALATCEAALDFADEDDVPRDVAIGAASEAAAIRLAVATAIEGARRGERVRNGYQIVIAGAPNAGKSTLLNALARRDVAIVSPIPGTTRDVIEVRCDLDGLPVTFFDTAGLRDGADLLEQEGMSRARARMAEADLVLWLEAEDAGRVGPPEEESSQDRRASSARVLIVGTKADLGATSPRAELALSAATGEGLPELLLRIGALAAADMTGGSDALVTRERHHQALVGVLRCLDRAAVCGQDGPIELLAEDLRLALRHLGRITGTVDVEDVLDRVFSSFCIGK